MKKEIIFSILSIGIIAVFLNAGTYAYFGDIETSTGNTFTADVGPDLEIRDNDEPWGNGVTATWTATGMKPGDSYDFLVPQIDLRNVGSNPVDVGITCDYAVIEEDPQTESDTDQYTNLDPDSMAKQMIITKCTYTNSETVNCLTDSNPDRRIDDQDGDGKITFYDLKNDPLNNLPSMGGGVGSFQMSVKFSEDAGNDFQGDTFNLTMIFTLNQDS